MSVVARIGVSPASERLPFRKVVVVGLGYIGLPTAACFAQAGVEVEGVDINPTIVEAVNAGKAVTTESDIELLVRRTVGSGRLRAVHEPRTADAFLITVPTPVLSDGSNGADLSRVEAAADAIAPVLKKGDLVVLESTSPVGTTRNIAERMAAARPDLTFPDPGNPDSPCDILVVYSPERIIPGKTLEELGGNDRVIGGMTPTAAKRAAALYRLIGKGEVHLTDDRTAEMVKLAENAFRDVNIAFANEISSVAESLLLDPWDVIRLANRHPRVTVLNPGPGVGGHCIAIDPWFLVSAAPEKAHLMRAAREVNDAKPRAVIEKVSFALNSNPAATIACLGLTYKPDIDDFRQSPALHIARELTRRLSGRVVCADPFAERLPAPLLKELRIVPSEQAVKADIVVVLVGHSAFKRVRRPAGRTVIDTCGFWCRQS